MSEEVETNNPIPVCSTCGSQTRRIYAVGGKGRYQCIKNGCPDKSWHIRGSKKKVEVELISEEERAEMVIRVDASHLADYDGSRRKYADTVSRSEVLKKKARAGMNGHN